MLRDTRSAPEDGTEHLFQPLVWVGHVTLLDQKSPEKQETLDSSFTCALGFAHGSTPQNFWVSSLTWTAARLENALGPISIRKDLFQ